MKKLSSRLLADTVRSRRKELQRFDGVGLSCGIGSHEHRETIAELARELLEVAPVAKRYALDGQTHSSPLANHATCARA